MIGQCIIAEPADQSRVVSQYIIVREWPNALELVPAERGAQCWRPLRIELDGPKKWIILARGRVNALTQQLIKWLTEDYKQAKIEWNPRIIQQFKETADLLLQVLLAGEGLIGSMIRAEQPMQDNAGEYIVLNQTDRCLYVVSTDLYALGKTRHIPIVTKDAWHILEVSPGVTALSQLIGGLRSIDGTEAERQELTAYLDKWARSGQS